MNTYQLVSAALLAGVGIFLQLASPVLGIPTGFGMTVDLVGVPVLLAFFVLGYEAALYVLAILAVLITFASPAGYIGSIMKFSAVLPMLLVPALYLVARKSKMARAKAAAFFLLILLGLFALFAVSSYLYVFSADRFTSSFLVGLFPTLLVLAFSYVCLRLWKGHEGELDVKSLASPGTAFSVLVLALLVRGVLMVVANFYFAGPLFFKMSAAEFVGFVESNARLPVWGAGAWYALVFFWNVLQGALEFAIAWILAYSFGLSKKYGA